MVNLRVEARDPPFVVSFSSMAFRTGGIIATNVGIALCNMAHSTRYSKTENPF